jgi:hypothetical protein
MTARIDNVLPKQASSTAVASLLQNVQAPPECVVPVRRDATQPTSLEQAFAESWKERCKLDQVSDARL